jgi:hypothetical protein
MLASCRERPFCAVAALVVQYGAYAYIRINAIRAMMLAIAHIHRGIAANKRPGDWVPCWAGTAMVGAGIGCCRPARLWPRAVP